MWDSDPRFNDPQVDRGFFGWDGSDWLQINDLPTVDYLPNTQQYHFQIFRDGTVQLDSPGLYYAFIFEFGGEYFVVDSVPDSFSRDEGWSVDIDGKTFSWTAETELMPGDSTTGTVQLPILDFVVDYAPGGQLRLASPEFVESSASEAGLEVTELAISYSIEVISNVIVSVDNLVQSLFSQTAASVTDGSINNTVTGVVEATALVTASLATATEFTLPTMDFGDMATTALGAVNTGDITLGVNSAIDEAETTYTNAIYAALTQIGGSVDTGAVVINVASNMSAVDGSITNVMSQVNGSIGNLSTTALGAVNTGTITSGVDVAVQGIVGMSGQ